MLILRSGFKKGENEPSQMYDYQTFLKAQVLTSNLSSLDVLAPDSPASRGTPPAQPTDHNTIAEQPEMDIEIIHTPLDTEDMAIEPPQDYISHNPLHDPATPLP